MKIKKQSENIVHSPIILPDDWRAIIIWAPVFVNLCVYSLKKNILPKSVGIKQTAVEHLPVTRVQEFHRAHFSVHCPFDSLNHCLIFWKMLWLHTCRRMIELSVFVRPQMNSFQRKQTRRPPSFAGQSVWIHMKVSFSIENLFSRADQSGTARLTIHDLLLLCLGRRGRISHYSTRVLGKTCKSTKRGIVGIQGWRHETF